MTRAELSLIISQANLDSKKKTHKGQSTAHTDRWNWAKTRRKIGEGSKP